MFLGFDLLIITLCTISLLTNSFGCYLMCQILNGKRKTGQKLYLLNLSIVGIVKNTNEITSLSIAVTFGKTPPNLAQAVQHHLAILSETMMTLMYYATMFHITIERIIAVRSRMKYQYQNTIKRCKITLAITWIIGVIIGLIFCLLHAVYDYYYAPYNFYIYIVINVSFIIVAVYTYLMLFVEHKNSVFLRQQNHKRKSSIIEVYQESRFHIPIMLMSSFLILVVVPDIVYVVLIGLADGFRRNFDLQELSHGSTVIWHCMVVLNVLSDVSNACIYIFADKSIRKVMFVKLRKGKKWFIRKSTGSSHDIKMAKRRSGVTNFLRETNC